MSKPVIPVTRTFLPPMEEYTAILRRAWDKQWITNRGELVQELEAALRKTLDVPFLTLTNNGTIPLQIALRALNITGEVITTPFSYVATTAAIAWERCTPVFVDIDPLTLTIDEKRIEEAITPNTQAILATHVFGNPCNVEVIDKIAATHNLKVIYDAAHCFGVRYQNRSVFTYGDVSTCSFHATKLFQTGEGGAMITQDTDLQHRLFYSHNFGHKGALEFHGLGVNAKMSELQAAMGLAVYPYLDTIFSTRKTAAAYYDQHVSPSLQRMKIREGTEWNYSYYPVLFESEEAVLAAEKYLRDNQIIPRRYFYPSLNLTPFVRHSPMPVSEQTASRILCLPLFACMTEEELERVTSCVNQSVAAHV